MGNERRATRIMDSDMTQKPAQRGRPRKYDHIISALEPNQLYSAGSIIVFAKEAQLLEPFITEDCSETMAATRLRVALNFFRRTRNFPPKGDGDLMLPGQASVYAWYGWRWQKEYISS